jgi:OmpA-OmpF porin, OOP family
MRLRCLLTVTAALGLLLLGQSAARAQGGPIDIQMFKPAMDSKGHFSVDSTQVLAPWATSFGLLGNYAHKPLVLKSDNGRFFETNHLVGANLQFAIGMMKLSKRGKPWMEIGIGLPIGFHQSQMGYSPFVRPHLDSNCPSPAPNGTDGCTVWQQDNVDQEKYPLGYDSEGGSVAQGLGDIYLHLKFRFLDTSTSPLGVGAMLTMYFPSSRVGDGHLKMMGTGGFTLAPKLLMDWRWRKAKVLLSLNVGARIRFSTTGELRENDGWSNCGWTPVATGTLLPQSNPCGAEDNNYGFNSDQGDNGLSWRVKTLYEVTYGLGLTWRLSKSVAWVNEIFGSIELSSLAAEDGTSDAGQIGTDLGYTAQYYKNVFPIEFLTGFKFYLATNSYFAIGGGVGITGLIGDHVGAPDFRAYVSFVFEPSTGDRDGDGIMDDVDKCPDDPEDFDDFEDKNGCPDPDNDKDGIPDVDDKCPNVPENFNGFQDKDGCPDNIDGDRDGDGIPDSKDKCPDLPEDKDHFEDKDGCPDPDNDGDGVNDKGDKCPGYDSDKRDNFIKVKEDKDGFEDEDGCPDPDNDKDGILDKDDKCPNEPESFNQYKDEDGCPDKSPITITKDRVLIMEKIYFETNKAKIRSISFPILNTVAKTLIAHKELKIIEIQGHTDERGSNRHNLRLSQRRANSVRNYLINKGLGADRLTSRGYGEDQPKCRQHNRACWSKNRRSEFVILKRD